MQGRTKDVGEIKSLYCRVKRQLLGETLNAAKASLYPSLIQHPKLRVTFENEAFCVLVKKVLLCREETACVDKEFVVFILCPHHFSRFGKVHC